MFRALSSPSQCAGHAREHQARGLFFLSDFASTRAGIRLADTRHRAHWLRTLLVGESLQVMFVSSTSSPMKLTVFASSANTVFFRRRTARDMRIRAAISTSNLMLIKHYLQWGTRLKFCQQVRNGSIGRSQPGRDGAVSVGGDVPSCMSSCMPQAVSCIHMSVVGIQVETTRSGGWRISASDDDNALIE